MCGKTRLSPLSSPRHSAAKTLILRGGSGAGNCGRRPGWSRSAAGRASGRAGQGRVASPGWARVLLHAALGDSVGVPAPGPHRGAGVPLLEPLSVLGPSNLPPKASEWQSRRQARLTVHARAAGKGRRPQAFGVVTSREDPAGLLIKYSFRLLKHGALKAPCLVRQGVCLFVTCINIFPACSYVHHVCAWCLWRSEEYVRRIRGRNYS